MRFELVCWPLRKMVQGWFAISTQEELAMWQITNHRNLSWRGRKLNAFKEKRRHWRVSFYSSSGVVGDMVFIASLATILIFDYSKSWAIYPMTAYYAAPLLQHDENVGLIRNEVSIRYPGSAFATFGASREDEFFINRKFRAGVYYWLSSLD